MTGVLLLSLLVRTRTLTPVRIEPGDVSPQVGVWVMTFFDQADRFHHWADVKRRHAAMPIGGAFSCSDPAEVAKEYGEIRAAGIDYVLLDDTNTLHVDDDLIDKSVRAWFDYSDGQPADKRLAIAIAAGGELNQHDNVKGWSAAVDELYHRYAGRPSYLHANGKPVLYWYVERDVEPGWADARWTVRQTYHFFRTEDGYRHGGWGYGTNDAPRPLDLASASISPGWDLSPPGYARRGGALYCERWCHAIESRARSILLSDWNGWNEGTALGESLRWLDNYGEPSPQWYMDLTRGYVRLFKGGFEEGAYYRSDGTPNVYRFETGRFVYQGEYPDGKPVVVVPHGYGHGFPSSR